MMINTIPGKRISDRIIPGIFELLFIAFQLLPDGQDKPNNGDALCGRWIDIADSINQVLHVPLAAGSEPVTPAAGQRAEHR